MNNLISFFMIIIFTLGLVFAFKMLIKVIRDGINSIKDTFQFAKELILSINEDKTHYL